MKRRLSGFLLVLLSLLTACGPTPQGGTRPMTLPEGKPRPVEVTFTSPQGEVDSLDDTRDILVGFNQPMTALQPLPVDSGTGPLFLEPRVAGKYRWKGTATLVFTPDQPLPYATAFKATVPARTPSYNRQELAQDHVFEFETPRPRLVKSDPANEARWQPLEPVMLLEFNQPMDPARLAGQLRFESVPEGSKGVIVEATVRAPDSKELERYFGLEPDEGTKAKFSHLVAVLPAKPLETGTSYELLLPKGLLGAGGPLGSAEEATIAFSTVNKFTAEGLRENKSKSVRPDEALTFEFSNPVSYAQLAKNVTFEPAVKIPESYFEDADYTSDSLYLYLRLQPRTDYTVRLAPEIEDQFGNKLGQGATYTFRTGDYEPGVRMPEGTAVLETRAGEARIPIGMLNMPKTPLEVTVLSQEEVLRAAHDVGSYKPQGKKLSVSLAANDQPNVVQDRYFKVDEALGQQSSGWLYLQLDRPDRQDDDRRLLVQVTNLGLTAKFSPENTVAWVTALDTGKPLAGATVELRTQDNKLLDTASTRPDGTVSFKGWATYGLKQEDRWSQPELYLFARSGQDVAFIGNTWNWNIDPWTFDLDYDYSPDLPTRVGMAFTERGLYRAGDEVYVKGALRELKNGRWQLSELKQLDFKLMDSRDQLVSMGVVDLGSFGSFDHTLKLPKAGSTGWYSLYYYLPGEARKSLKSSDVSPLFTESFRVEAFRPAQFEVKVDVDQPFYAFGDKLQAELLGRYLYGGLMKGDALQWTVRAEPMSFRPEGWDGYDFSPTGWREDDDAQAEEAKILSSGKGTLDKEGQKKLAVDLALKYRRSAAVMVEGTVTSASRQQISGRATVMVHPGSFLIGLRPKSSFLSAGQPAAIDVVTVKPDGKADSGRRVNLELFRREWHSVRRAGTGGDYRWVVTFEDQKVGEPVVVNSSDSPVPATLQPAKSGYYVVKATAQDEKGRTVESQTSFYASGSDYVAWGRGENDTIELVADQRSYKPGETARILVKSPYESCTALVTVERELVMRRFVVELKGSTPTIDLPILSEDLPNAFVSVVLVQGRIPDKGLDDTGEDLGKPSFRLGYLNLPVDTGEKRLSVSVKTDREEYQPRQTVTIDLEVKDSQGRPVQAEVDVAVVDRGVLNLIDYATPDFFGPFYGPRSLRVRTAELRRDVIGMRSYGSKGDPEGGGGGESSGETREDFRATPYWNPKVMTDAQGRARVTFTLPDSLTSFRVMATALTRQSDFGAGESELRVNKQLQLLPSTPRFVRVGDTFRAGVLVSNNSQEPGTIEVRVQAEGVDLSGEPSATVHVAAGEQKEALFDFAAKKPGDGSLVFQASMGPHKDGLRLPLPVQAPIARETVATTGSFTAGTKQEVLDLSSRPAPSAGGLTVTLSSTLLSGLQGGLAFLETYPYGCAEQRLSQIAPNLLFPDLLKAYGEGSSSKSRQVTQQILDDLRPYQSPSGGMLLWPDSTRVSDYLSVYALDLLDRAKTLKYKVDEKMLLDLRAYVKRIPSATQFDYPYGKPAQAVVKSYAVAVLARLGVKDRAAFDLLYAKRKDAPLEARVHLLEAARLMGVGREVRSTLRNELTSRVRMEADSAYFAEKDEAELAFVYGSNLRTTALILAVLLEEESPPDFLPKVVKYLMGAQQAGHWSTTQNNVAVLRALSLYAQKFEADSPSFTATAKVEAKTVLEQAFRGRGALVASRSVPMSELPQGRVPVDIAHSGKGRLYYALRLQYAPAENVPARDEGFMVLRQVVPVEGAPSGDPTLRAGQIYRVTLSVITPKERQFVVLDEPLPGGLEVVQTTFATESQALTRSLELGAKSKGDWWGGTFDHFEIHDDRVLLFAESLSAGEHTFEYLVRAGYPGKYDQPATRCEEMYRPEVFGTTNRETVEVR